MKLDSCLSPSQKSRWIKDLNFTSKILTLLEENIRKILDDMGIGKNFLNRTPAAQEEPHGLATGIT